MARPLRIQYEGAWYHVMNRGIGRQAIFHNGDHYSLFLDLLQEVQSRYEFEIHAYCLMGNHYHLLIRTPLANLSRGMQHLSGIYTQRFNKTRKTDGPLLRGRYKSIVVDADNYLLQLSRYIHLNPVAAKIVTDAREYRWSSFNSYIKPNSKPNWLTCNKVLAHFGVDNPELKYKRFVEKGVDVETEEFFMKKHKTPVFGGKLFEKYILEKHIPEHEPIAEIPEHSNFIKNHLPSPSLIMKVAADYYLVKVDHLKKQYPNRGNKPRNVAIYLMAHLAKLAYKEISEKITNTSTHGISKTVCRFKKIIESSVDERKEIQNIERLVTDQADKS